MDEITFDDTGKAFNSKSNKELKEAYFLFRLINNPLMVKAGKMLTPIMLAMRLPIKTILKNTVFKQFCGGESIDECNKVLENLDKAGIGSILDYSIEGKNREEDFNKTRDEILRIISLAAKNPAIPYTSVKLTGIMKGSILEKLSAKKTLKGDEKELHKRAIERLDQICHFAWENKVPIYIDAEESWIQDCVDELCEDMMKKYNSEKAIVSTTLQMYRHDRIYYLNNLIGKARSEKFFLGIKLVRGAYWEKENLRAMEQGYNSPVHITKKNTDSDFNKAVSLCIDNIDIVSLCAGTHNEKSTHFLLKKMKEKGISPGNTNVYFSQLYGMSDHISFNLASAGYNVTKYLPYGPVQSVVPYLIRRAEENTAIAGQMGRELQLLINEIKRRKKNKE
jgi:proline dehydrogenase